MGISYPLGGEKSTKARISSSRVGDHFLQKKIVTSKYSTTSTPPPGQPFFPPLPIFSGGLCPPLLSFFSLHLMLLPLSTFQFHIYSFLLPTKPKPVHNTSQYNSILYKIIYFIYRKTTFLSIVSSFPEK